MNLHEYKKLFFKNNLIHLNNGGLSPISRPVYEEIHYWAKRFYEEGFHTDTDYKKRVEWTRCQIAELIKCETDEIAFFQSCAWGISQFAFSCGLKESDEVLLFDQEYSSNLYPWQAACAKADAKLKVLPSTPDLDFDYELLLKSITDKTKVITVSWVQYQTGALADLKLISEICHKSGILFFVDATQGLGIHSINFKDLNIDGLASGSHKWLNAPVGVGFLAIKKSLALKMNPLGYGAMTYGECEDPSELECLPKLNALKFEPGAKQVLEITGLGVAIYIINQVGTEIIKTEAFRLASKLRSTLIDNGFKVHSPFRLDTESQFVSFTGAQANKEIQKYLYDSGYHIPIRGPGIRLTPHAINTDDEIENFLNRLKLFSVK